MVPRLHIPRSFSVLFWVFLIVIGAVTGLVAFVASLCVSLCLRTLSKEVSFVMLRHEDIRAGYLILFVSVNLLAVLISAALVLFISPLAAGSGIPNMFAYVNGVEMPEFLNLRVALAKVPGSILAVTGGLCIGKEGPLLHVGSIIATWLGSTKLFKSLRRSREQEPLTYERHARELVACGIAAGLAAGFQAPVGGLLFALEMSTRWRHELTARTLFACAVVAFVSQAAKEARGDSEIFNYGSLLFFQDSLHFPKPYAQLPLMAVLGLLGGFIGCMFTSLNIRLGTKRRSYTSNKKLRLLEVGIVGLLTTALRLILPLLGKCQDCLCDPEGIENEDDECECAPGAPGLQKFQLYGCDEGSYNDLAVFMFNPQGYLIKALLTAPFSAFSGTSLLLLFLFYYFLSILTYGMAIPAGLFTPSLISGGALGQLFAFVVNKFLDLCGSSWRINSQLYALLGAASVLGGLFRFSVSFSVILVELTGAEKQLPFLMFVLILAKGIGDRINQSILNHLCILLKLPYIGGHPESTIRRKGLHASDIMDDHYPTLKVEEDRSVLMSMMHSDRYSAYPVVEVTSDELQESKEPNYLGMIARDDIQQALDLDSDEGHNGSSSVDSKVNLGKFISRPPVISADMKLTFLYRMHNTSGLEFIPVMEKYGPLRGLITRHQLVDSQNRYIDPQNIQGRLESQRKSLSGEPNTAPLMHEEEEDGVGIL